MSTSLEPSTHEQVAEAVSRLLNEAKEQELVERRSAPRFPFFQPATLAYRYRTEEPVSVFTREISSIGIGLLHSVPLERGEVALTINGRGGTVTFRTYLLWCKPSGQWYL